MGVCQIDQVWLLTGKAMLTTLENLLVLSVPENSFQGLEELLVLGFV